MEELQRTQWTAFSAATQPSVVLGGEHSSYQMGLALKVFPHCVSRAKCQRR